MTVVLHDGRQHLQQVGQRRWCGGSTCAVPNAMLQNLRLPTVSGHPMAALLLPAGRWQASPAAVVSIDPGTVQVLSVQDPTPDNVSASILICLRALHEGGAAGPLGRVMDVPFRNRFATAASNPIDDVVLAMTPAHDESTERRAAHR